MSAVVKLSAKLPGEPEINGLDALAQSITDNPDQVIVALVWFDVQKITHDRDAGVDVPTVRARKVEPIDTVDRVPAEVIKLAAELNEKRLNRSPLPFDLLDVEDGGYVVPPSRVDDEPADEAGDDEGEG